MNSVFLSLLLVSLITMYAPTASATPAEEECLACHGEKGMRGYVDREILNQSVHKNIGCKKCHFDVTDVPHGKVLKVNCGSCHFLGREGAPREQALEYKLSVHGAAVRLGKPGAPDCQACHGTHAILASPDGRSRTNRMNIPRLCSGCHAREFKEYGNSIHGREFLGKKNAAAAVCFDCHLEHRVPAAGDPAWKLTLIQECGNCHVEELETYRKTFHGKVTRLGYETMAKCSDCHGSHLILAVADGNSMLSPGNRLTTCRACHPHATEGFTKYYAHAEELNRRKYPELFWTYAFMNALLISVFAFFFIHTFLWAFRSLKEKLGQRKEGR